MKKFNLVSDFKGYVNKSDITNLDARLLVFPSQNVLINNGEKVATRGGYTLYGVANAALTPIDSSYDWITSTNVERNLRKYDVNLEVYYSGAWRTISSSFASTDRLQFREWWSSAEAKDLLLIADGTSTLKMWSGGITTYASATANTITKQGTNTWAQDRFLVAGTRTLVIGGITYTYTGGESTTTLTGVTPDPTLGVHTAGDVAIQAIRSTANTPAAGVSNDIIEVNNNHVYISDLDRRDIYVSKNTDYTAFTFSSPRLPGEGALLTLDANPVGFSVQEDSVYVSGSQNDWYQIVFKSSDDLTKETVSVQKLKSGPGQGAYHQDSIGKIKNSVIYFSREKAVDTLGRLENIDTPQSKPLSDAIKLELEDYDVTIAPHIKYFKNQTFIAFPSESKVLIYDHQNGYWQPPQVLPVRRFAVISGELYGHSNSVAETYKLFEGTNDNENGFQAIASMSYRNYGQRAWKKTLNEWYTEGYISANTVIDVAIKFDFGGSTSIITKEIDGSLPRHRFSTISDNSIGKHPLGSQPLGSITDSPDNLPKFRIIHEISKLAKDFYEIQAVYQTDTVDAQWSMVANGGNVNLSTNDNTPIKEE